MSEFNLSTIQAAAPSVGAGPALEGTDSTESETAGNARFSEALAKRARASTELETSLARVDSAPIADSLSITRGNQLPAQGGLLLPGRVANGVAHVEALAPPPTAGPPAQVLPELPSAVRSANGTERLEALALQSHPGRAAQPPQELIDAVNVASNGQTKAGDNLDSKPIISTTTQLPFPEHRYSGIAEGMVVRSSLGGELTPLIASASYSALSSDPVELRPPLRLSIPVPPSGSGWDSTFSNRVAWMVSRNLQVAELQLYPPELGRVEVRISLQNGSADIHFGAQHVTAREAIESALPRLRETLADGGLDSVTVDVSRHTLSDGRSDGSRNTSKPFIPEGRPSDAPTGEEHPQETVFWAHDGLIDHYA